MALARPIRYFTDIGWINMVQAHSFLFDTNIGAALCAAVGDVPALGQKGCEIYVDIFLVGEPPVAATTQGEGGCVNDDQRWWVRFYTHICHADAAEKVLWGAAKEKIAMSLVPWAQPMNVVIYEIALIRYMRINLRRSWQTFANTMKKIIMKLSVYTIVLSLQRSSTDCVKSVMKKARTLFTQFCYLQGAMKGAGRV